MIRKVLVGTLMLAGLSMVASAAPVDCTGIKTLQDLITANTAGGCEHQDKIFSNFVYTGSVSAANVSASHEFSGGGIGLADVHGWLFSTQGGWSSTFTLSYNVAVDLALFPNQVMYASKDQIQTGLLPNGVVVTDTQSVGTLIATGILGNETKQITYGNVTSLTTSSTFTCAAGVAGSTGCNLQSLEQNFFERSNAVPEPASFGLIGLGLVGLAAFKRRQKSVR